jgi:hypothetical protein
MLRPSTAISPSAGVDDRHDVDADGAELLLQRRDRPIGDCLRDAGEDDLDVDERRPVAGGGGEELLRLGDVLGTAGGVVAEAGPLRQVIRQKRPRAHRRRDGARELRRRPAVHCRDSSLISAFRRQR